MKNRLFTLAGALALLAVLGKFYALPAIADSVRAALIRDSDNGALQPVSFYIPVNESSASIYIAVDGPTVPAGKRLVVEDVTVAGVIPSSTELTAVFLVNKLGARYLALGPQTTERYVTTFTGMSQYNYNRVVKAYYDPGDIMQVQVFHDSLTPGTPVPVGGIQLNIYVKGYYVNLLSSAGGE